MMLVNVETCSDQEATEVPCRLRFDARAVDIAEIVDRWYGQDYCYFKVRSGAGDLYILRLDESRGEWDLTMFQSAQPHAIPLEFLATKRPASAVTM
jgi:hypothetical protein